MNCRNFMKNQQSMIEHDYNVSKMTIQNFKTLIFAKKIGYLHLFRTIQTCKCKVRKMTTKTKYVHLVHNSGS